MARVLVIGDTHAPCMVPAYADWLVDLKEQWECNKVVHIGDLVDMTSLSFHLKKPHQKNPLEEKEKAQEQVDMLVERFPKCDWLLGNHDVLPYRWCDQVGIPESMMKKPGQIWNTKKWKVHPRYTDLIIDNVIYRHGDKGKGGRLAALSNAIVEFRSVVQGHLHQQAGVEYLANKCERVFGCQTGCGVDADHAAMEYGIKYSQKPILGAAIVLEGEVAIFEPFPKKCRGTR